MSAIPANDRQQPCPYHRSGLKHGKRWTDTGQYRDQNPAALDTADNPHHAGASILDIPEMGCEILGYPDAIENFRHWTPPLPRLPSCALSGNGHNLNLLNQIGGVD